MLVPARAICRILTDREFDYIDEDGEKKKAPRSIRGVLAEAVSIQLQSEYQPLMSDGDINDDTLAAMGKFANAIGVITRSVSGGRAGFSTKFKQGTTQIWKSTSPASFQITVDFRRDAINGEHKGVNAANNLMPVVKALCSLPLPVEGGGDKGIGNLIPPGPSLFEAIGIEKILTLGPSDKLEGLEDGTGIVDVKLGNMMFKRLIMKSVEPSFSQVVDDSGYPISCRITMQFTSMWAATDMTIKEW